MDERDKKEAGARGSVPPRGESILVAGAADELADEGVFRDGGIVFHGGEVLEHFVDALGADVGVLALGLVLEFLDGGREILEELGLQDGQLEGHGAVDEVVDGADERDDVAELGAADVVPVGERLLGLEVPVPGVADHAAEEAVVGPAHEGALGVLDLSEGLDVELELLGVRGGLGHLAVEAVEGVDEEDFVLGEGHLVDVQFALAGLEVVVGGLDGLAFEEGGDVFVDELEVEGVGRLVVVVAELVLGVLLEVEEVVVEVDGLDMMPVSAYSARTRCRR